MVWAGTARMRMGMRTVASLGGVRASVPTGLDARLLHVEVAVAMSRRAQRVRTKIRNKGSHGCRGLRISVTNGHVGVLERGCHIALCLHLVLRLQCCCRSGGLTFCLCHYCCCRPVQRPPQRQSTVAGEIGRCQVQQGSMRDDRVSAGETTAV